MNWARQELSVAVRMNFLGLLEAEILVHCSPRVKIDNDAKLLVSNDG